MPKKEGKARNIRERKTNNKRQSYPALRSNVLHLVVGALSDPLAAPQLNSNLEVGITHGADRQEVREDRKHHVISGGPFQGRSRTRDREHDPRRWKKENTILAHAEYKSAWTAIYTLRSLDDFAKNERILQRQYIYCSQGLTLVLYQGTSFNKVSVGIRLRAPRSLSTWSNWPKECLPNLATDF